MQPFAKKPPTLYGAAMSHLPRSLCVWCVVRGKGWAAVLVAGREVVEGGGWGEPQQQHQRPTAITIYGQQELTPPAMKLWNLLPSSSLAQHVKGAKIM